MLKRAIFTANCRPSSGVGVISHPLGLMEWEPKRHLYHDIGFRVAIVPEPSVGGLMALGMALVAWKRKGR